MIQRVINGLIILMLNMASSNYADLLSVKVWPPTLASQLGPVWRFGGGGWREGGRVRIRGKERNGRKKEEACRMAEQEGGTTKGEGKIGRKQRGGRNLEGKKKWCWEEVGWMRRGGALVWPSVLNSSIFFLSSPPLSTPPVDRREELCSERSRLTSVASPPHPMRYVTGPSPAISSCCHHLFIFPGSSSSPRVCPQRRLVQVSLTSASRGEDEERVLSLLIVLGLELIAPNARSCHACSALQCFTVRGDTCWRASLAVAKKGTGQVGYSVDEHQLCQLCCARGILLEVFIFLLLTNHKKAPLSSKRSH